MDVWAGVALAALGVAVPVGAALYEFVFKGRKRLGYRVQMDTTATDVAGTIDAAGALTQLQMDGHDLQDPTLVLLRIENGVGLEKLNAARSAEMIAFSDGPKPDLYPGLVPRPLALFLFTLVVNDDAGVHNLSIARIREIYQGRYTNWSEMGGNDVPILLVSRNTQSGTRTTFQKRILAGVREEATNSNDCRDRDPGGKAGPLRCERGSTADLLDVVAKQPGAMGYSELGAATGGEGVALVTIGESPATSGAADQGAYPFWETEFGYTYGEPPATSLAASFLRYLTNQVGADILRTHGNRPCNELQSPALCRPARPAGSP